MALKLSKSDRSNLILTIAELLRSARTMPSGRLRIRGSASAARHLAEQIGSEIDQKIIAICGEGGLLDFVRFQLHRQILAKNLESKSRQLIEIEGYEDTIAVASDLVDQLDALPQKLRIASPLPAGFGHVMFNGLGNVDVGNGIKIIRGDELIKTSPITTGSDRLDEWVVKPADLSEYPLREENHFFVSWHSGFAGNFHGNMSIQEHFDKLRGFLGCLLALGIVEEDYVENATENVVLVHDVSNSQDSVLVLTSRTDSDVSSFYENFDLEMDFLKNPFQGFDEEDEDSEVAEELSAEQMKARDRILGEVKAVFGNDDHNRRIFTSCLWLFRSFTSVRRMDIILESIIALEVLLGDRETADRIGLTKLMSNRCAYLLGESRAEREQIMQEFKNIYDIRSQIVHAGLHQMNRAAEQASQKARALAGRVIRKELQLATS